MRHYDPKGMRNRMSEMENQTDLSFNSRDDGRVLRDFMALHDPDWFMCGKKVESDYSDEATKAKKLEDDDHPIEFKVAERLSACGIRAVFVDDEVVEFDAAKGLDQVIDLPDLDTGLEIKNVFSAKSKNTISGYIGKAKKKRGFQQIVIDASENRNLSDERARQMIANSLRRHSLTSALMVNHDKKVETVFRF